jgi:uncharacterized protein
MQVVLAGASGLIGTALKELLRSSGAEVKTLVRHPTSETGEDSWDPAKGLLDPDFLADADAVVCLSGVGIGDHRWTESYKQEILTSRLDSVGTVARTLAEYGGPRVLVAASAVGYYGDTGDRLITEQAPAGSSFLSSVCTQWEAAADTARDAGVRVAHLRTGLVLSADGGLLARLKPIVQAGVAGKLGSGKQYMPWISLHDHVRAIEFLLTHEVHGAVNLTGPEPVRNAEFMDLLGSVLRRPTVIPTPGIAVRTVLGEFAEDVLTGQRAVPAVLTEAGFRFGHTDAESALRWALDR